MKFYKFLLCFFAVLVAYGSQGQSWKKYPYSPPGSLINFPKDEGVHADSSEWWYTIGHIKGATTGKNYSFMLAYFKYPISRFNGFRILNISDEDGGHFSSETLPFRTIVMAKDSLNLDVSVFNGKEEKWSNVVGPNGKIPFEYVLSATSAAGALNLTFVAQKPPLILGDSGFFYQGATNYTYYYSQTENAVTGTITYNGVTENVTGISWIDRQYGSFNPLNTGKYEWFSIQLSNGMDINAFNIFTINNQIPDTSTYRLLAAYVDTATQFTISHFNIERLAFHYNDTMCYSQKWRITAPQKGIDLVLEANNPNCEVKLPLRFYEGTTTISGTVNGKAVTGVGFAELLHNYSKPQLEVFSPPATTPGSITWKLKNPDAADPISYDLQISADQLNWSPVAKSINDTMFQLSNPGSDYYVKLIGYSIDSTLVSEVIKHVAGITAIQDPLQNNNSLKVLIVDEEHLIILSDRESSQVKYQVSTIEGRTLPCHIKSSGNPVLVDIGHLTSGIYLLQGIEDGNVTRCKFVVP